MSEPTTLRDLTGNLPEGDYVHETEVAHREAEAVRAAETRLLARVAKLPRPIYYKEPNPYEGIYICVWCDASWPWKDEHESPLRGHPANGCLWAEAHAVPARPEETT